MRYVNSWERVYHTLKDKDRDKDKDNETEKRKGGGEVKLYNTDTIASVVVDGIYTQLAMTIGGKVLGVKVPSHDFKVEYGEAFRKGDTLADWLARNGKEV